MALSYRVAKAGVVREDGKCFTAKTLKMFAKEAPEKYAYLSKQKELWLKKPVEKKKNVN
jgi:hypothetical protein